MLMSECDKIKKNNNSSCYFFFSLEKEWACVIINVSLCLFKLIFTLVFSLHYDTIRRISSRSLSNAMGQRVKNSPPKFVPIFIHVKSEKEIEYRKKK